MNLRVDKKSTFGSEYKSPQHYNPSLTMTYRDRCGTYTVFLGAGTHDEIDVYRCGSVRYVLTRNHNLQYMCLEVFDRGESVGEYFLMTDYAIGEVFSRGNEPLSFAADRALDLAPWSIIRTLDDYIGY